MKTTSIIVATAALAISAVSAQNGLMVPPGCAIDCITLLAPTSGCSSTDYACFCQSNVFRNQFNTCVTGTCSSQDFQTTKSAVEALCNSAGVSVDLTPATTSIPNIDTMISGTGMNSTATGFGNFSTSASPKPDKSSAWRQAEISLTALGTTLVLGAVMFCA
ncbi:hypothetical protein AA313_de0209336 [Arthrobotrys entomopaga]|nr:hypothetical protein AA313_de0209336 [Arthrobotrys entomopaga]